MTSKRLHAITRRYSELRIAVVGDFSLDRYLEIDPARKETSLETGLPVHNVARVRAQPGAAGTILNNLVALGAGTLHVVGFTGEDGEGFELRRALDSLKGVRTETFFSTSERQTFTYTKPLLTFPHKPPRELNRLDRKNWTPTPIALQRRIVTAVQQLAHKVDAIILMDQVELPGSGVVTSTVLRSIDLIARRRPGLFIIADSRRSLRGYPPVCLKMNRAELSRLSGRKSLLPLKEIGLRAALLAREKNRPCFVTLAEHGILGAAPDGSVQRVAALPVRGEIDIVGAGDAVTANLTAALTAGATLREALELANAAASIVIHKLGTTGTASPREILSLLHGPGSSL